jgi:fibroblast growth factor receptor substrate 2
MVIELNSENCEVFVLTKYVILGSDIILYRKNKPPLSWPLGSLRRYGFDANFFTFESGRRCETGEGVFSFKCQRADVLFNTLQSYINGRAYNTDDSNLHDFAVPNASNRNIAQLNSLNMGTLHTSIQGSSYVVNARPNSSLSPAGTNSLQSRSTDTLTADYLEPNPSRIITSHPTRLSANMRLSSLGSGGPLSPASPGSPNSYTNILEITNLNPIPQQQSHGNIYQEYPSSSLHLQKPTKLSLDVAPQEQAPVANHQKVIKNDPSMNVYMNAEIGNPIKEEVVVSKPAPRATLAQMESLEVEPEISSPDSSKAAAAVYMNVAIGDEKNKIAATPPAYNEAAKENIQPPVITTPPVLTNNLNSKFNDIQKDYTKNVGNGNIFGFNRTLSFSQDSTTRCYENMDIGLSEMKPLMLRNRYSRPEIFSKVDLPLIDRTDKSEPCTPTQRKVNYIVLDLDQPHQTTINNNNNNLNNNNISAKGNECSENSPSQMVTSVSLQNGLLPPESPKKLGYATIDFDRSNALSNVLSNNPIIDFDQSCRKTRHDSNVTPVLAAMKHSNSISD